MLAAGFAFWGEIGLGAEPAAAGGVKLPMKHTSNAHDPKPSRRPVLPSQPAEPQRPNQPIEPSGDTELPVDAPPEEVERHPDPRSRDTL